MAAELADAWIPAFVARDSLAGLADTLREMRQAAAPQAGPLTIAAGPLTVVAGDTAAARDIAAACVAWYLTAMGDVYATSVSRQGYAAQVKEIIAANPRPSPSRGIVPPGAEPVLEQLAAYGTGDQVSRQLKEWERAADIVTVMLPPGLPWHAIDATLRAGSARPSGTG